MGIKPDYLRIPRKEDRVEPPSGRVTHYKEFHIRMEEADRREQAARCKDCGVPFCQICDAAEGMVSGCPLGNLIPEWNDFLNRGNGQQALHRLLKTNNFPEFTSRVCPAPCEEACTGNLAGGPVCSKENEWFLAETGFACGLMGPVPPEVRSGKRVAVIGSGPAGLAAADQLNKRGHLVTVYEKSELPGGLLMFGIPNMKLEKQIVTRRIRLMEQEGVCFKTGAEIAAPEQARKLQEEYDAVILACGAGCPRDVEAEGRDAGGILYAVDYLSEATRNLIDPGHRLAAGMNAKGKRVLVIGGGDTGTDCVATAIRQGCKKIIQLIRRPAPPEEPVPGHPWPEKQKLLKTDYGQEEARELFGKDLRLFRTKVKEFLKDKTGQITGVQTIRLEEKTDGETGRTYLQEISGSEARIPCDMVLIAAGYSGPGETVPGAFGLQRNEKGGIATLRKDGYQTALPKVFAAGDCRRGASLVVWAIREGREAAREADAFLMGYTALP